MQGYGYWGLYKVALAIIALIVLVALIKDWLF